MDENHQEVDATHGNNDEHPWKKTMKISEKSMKTLEKSRDSANERF